VERRMETIISKAPFTERLMALNKFSQKLLNSGHIVKTVRSILLNGLKGYQRKDLELIPESQ
jgi:hypothetical protein